MENANAAPETSPLGYAIMHEGVVVADEDERRLCIFSTAADAFRVLASVKDQIPGAIVVTMHMLNLGEAQPPAAPAIRGVNPLCVSA